MIILKEDINSLVDDVKSLSYLYRKKYVAMSSDETVIKAAKEVAKENKVNYKEILKNIRPSGNISGSKSWDKGGNIITIR